MCRYGYIYNIEFFNLIEPLNTLDTLTIEYNTRKEKKIHTYNLTNFAKTKNENITHLEKCFRTNIYYDKNETERCFVCNNKNIFCIY